MTLQIKNKIREELNKQWIPNLEFLFSDQVLEVAEELILELLEEEKAAFDFKLTTPDENITFELFDDESILDYFTSYLYHLKWVFSTDKIRDIIENIEPKLVEFGNSISYNKRYFEMLQICLDKCELDWDQTKIIKDGIKAYKVRWIDLDSKNQDRLKEISQKLSKLSTDFSNNVLDSENEFSYTTRDFEIIKDLPKEVLERVKKSPPSQPSPFQEEGVEQGSAAILSPERGELERGEYVFTANPSDYINIMKYCSDADVRKLFQQTRTSFASNGKHDNRENVLQILKLKDEKAKILWFKNYAELSLVFKMADSPEQVTDLLWKVSERARVKAKEELIFLQDYFNLEEINEWDLAFYYRKLKEEKYQLDDKQLKKYFEFENVLEGLFMTVEKLFWLRLKQLPQEDIFGTENDVRIYEVFKDWKKIAYYMLDAFYREEKRSGAWMNNLRPKFEDKLPFVINVCNFAKDPKATLLSLWEVQTIFHEFGHASHDILGTSKYADLTGFHVEWDFIEVPSQFLEHWADEWEAIKMYAKHFETGETIPDDFLEKLKKLDTVWNWNFVLKQNEYAFQDMLLYSNTIPENVSDLDSIALETAKKYSLFEKQDNYKPYASFSHVFSWGYAAGYYSYMWAEILELDILREFKKKWMFNEELGRKYRETILEAGSTKKASELFHNFMWREVDVEWFFEKKGI